MFDKKIILSHETVNFYRLAMNCIISVKERLK